VGLATGNGRRAVVERQALSRGFPAGGRTPDRGHPKKPRTVLAETRRTAGLTGRDLSRIALEAELDPDELRTRLARMTDRALVEFGRAAAYMCTPYANLGQPPREPFVLQLEAARSEWRRRHGSESSPAA
jgi:hypothetical protein